MLLLAIVFFLTPFLLLSSPPRQPSPSKRNGNGVSGSSQTIGTSSHVVTRNMNEGSNSNSSSGALNNFSLINISQVHTHTLGRCGYCQNTRWVTSGFDCAQMSLVDYQLLMDRGWRRCGAYFYKPHVEQCCCRTFPIRLCASSYRPGNSQKKVMRKFEKMLEKQDHELYEVDSDDG